LALDPRRDSIEALAVNSDGEVLRLLREVREEQKSQGIQLGELHKSDAQHRNAMHTLSEGVVDLTKRMGAIEARVTRAEKGVDVARDTANEARKKVSDTVHEFQATMASVNANAAAIATTTEEVKKQNDEQTERIEAVVGQNEKQSTMLETIGKNAGKAVKAAEASTRRTTFWTSFFTVLVVSVFKILELFLAAKGH
jgi:chromosome segregation ATPase